MVSRFGLKADFRLRFCSFLVVPAFALQTFILRTFILLTFVLLTLQNPILAQSRPSTAESTEDEGNSAFERRDAGEMALGMSDMLPKSATDHPRVTVEPDHAKEAGLKMLEGKHVLIVTDMELTETVKNLPNAVDQAYPQMCAFFGVEQDPEWKLTVFLMKSNIPFLKANYLPDILPPFENGFSFNHDCWLYEQPSEYYRQHLTIHEMTHCFSTTRMGNAGPNWFAEGLAELLGMHDFSAAPIQLGFMPPNRQSVPYCGRIREIHDAISRGEVRTLDEVMSPTRNDYVTNAIYYWSWAFAWFLENNPETHDEFHAMVQNLTQEMPYSEFNRTFQKLLEPKRTQIEKHWLMFVASLEYDFCLKPMLFDASMGVPFSQKVKEETATKGRLVQKLQTNLGWQNTGVHFQKGQKIRIRAKGSFELAQSDETFWPCEPNGVTIEYLNGQPMGILQAVFLTDAQTLTSEIMNDRQPGTFYSPLPIGNSQTFTVPFDGTLLLRVNTPTARTEKNRGTVLVEISERK